MHPYTPYLIEDIALAHRSDNNIKENFSNNFEDEMEEVERYIQEDPPHTLSYFCGLLPENFPPPEQLSENDMEIICKAFDAMLF
nr:hypothetical protein [Bacteroidota bacterium]